MTLRRLGALLALPLLIAACSDDGTASGTMPDTNADAGKDAAAPDAGGPPGDSGGSATDAPLDCSASKWTDVSDACWSCMCGACKEKLDACNADCMSILACGLEKDTFVGCSGQLQCEITATTQLCLAPSTPAVQAQAQNLVNFDLCLISAKKASGFRACEAECGITYSGTVCERYPAANAAKTCAPAGDAGP